MTELTEEKKTNKDDKLKARVFISCGQQKKTDEEDIALQIKNKLRSMGYCAYVAIKEQITKGFKENIFQRLENSEYFIFIDFKREKLRCIKKIYRGSLFSHQELALAAYLNKPIIAFQEKGVKEKDGISSVIQLNPTEFSSRPDLANCVISEVEKKEEVGEWNNNWRDELVLERSSDDIVEADYEWSKESKEPAIFYHVKVRNNHRTKVALRCLSYIERIKNVNTGEEKRLDLIENKWKGIKDTSVQIPPYKKPRKFDGFFVFKNKYHEAYLGYNRAITDFTGYHQEYKLKAPGEYEISYVVYSENFFPARATFKLKLTSNIKDIEFSKIKGEVMKKIIVKKEFLPSMIDSIDFITATQLGRIAGSIRYNNILQALISKDEDVNTSLHFYLLLNHAALVYEGIKTFKKTKSIFEKQNHYQNNLEKIEIIINEAQDKESFYNKTLKIVRDKIAFHFDRDVIVEVLRDVTDDLIKENKEVVFISGKSEIVKDIIYLFADNMNINYVLKSINGKELETPERFKIFCEKLLYLSGLFCEIIDELIPDLINESCEPKEE